MAENETGAVVEEQNFAIKVEDAGPAAKKVTIEIPRQRIDQKLSEQYKQLRQDAQIPGFRKGHAPQRLLEKKFSSEIKAEVCNALIRESYEEAVEKNSLNVIGEPAFDKPEELKLPEDGPLSYSFEVEVQPEFLLPPIAGLRVRKPKVDITDKHLEQAMTNLREQQGTLVPVEGRGVEEKDFVTADVHVKVDGNEVSHQDDAAMVARPGRIAGIPVEDLDKQLAGAKPGETRTFTVKAPENHPMEAVRGKDVQIDVAVKDIKRLEPAEINQDFLDNLGFANEQEVRDALREQMQLRVDSDVQRIMRMQVIKYLMENTQFEVPNRLSQRQTQQVVSRRAVEMLERGTPEDVIRANIEQLKATAAEEARNDLKLQFILQRIIGQEGIEVSEGELNGRVAGLALQGGQRPEKLRQEMAKDGRLLALYSSMAEGKALDRILSMASVEEFESEVTDHSKTAEELGAAGAPAETPAEGAAEAQPEAGKDESSAT